MRCWKLKGSEILYRGDPSASRVSDKTSHSHQVYRPSTLDCIRLCLEPGLADISCTLPGPSTADSQSSVCRDVNSCLLFCLLNSLDPFAINVFPKLSVLLFLACMFPKTDLLSVELFEVDLSIDMAGDKELPSGGVRGVRLASDVLLRERFCRRLGRRTSSVNARWWRVGLGVKDRRCMF